MAEQENILVRLGKLFQNQIVVRKTPTGQLKVKDVIVLILSCKIINIT